MPMPMRVLAVRRGGRVVGRMVMVVVEVVVAVPVLMDGRWVPVGMGNAAQRPATRHRAP
ncbi:MAG: hypothetical protein ACOX0O_00645 [Candidatus Methanoculleus thermohydrogenotrophicum]